jgi:hypothetical protein
VRADKVYLVGFMGAGKTTVARALARRLDWETEDIDERIERRERRDIAAIFRHRTVGRSRATSWSRCSDSAASWWRRAAAPWRIRAAAS